MPRLSIPSGSSRGRYGRDFRTGPCERVIGRGASKLKRGNALPGEPRPSLKSDPFWPEIEMRKIKGLTNIIDLPNVPEIGINRYKRTISLTTITDKGTEEEYTLNLKTGDIEISIRSSSPIKEKNASWTMKFEDEGYPDALRLLRNCVFQAIENLWWQDRELREGPTHNKDITILTLLHWELTTIQDSIS